MHADPTTHPTPDELAAYSLGKLGDADTLAVAQHLETCHDCSKAAENVPPDSFVNIVQSVRVATLGPGVMPSRLDTPQDTGSPHALPADTGLEAPAELANHPRFRLVRELGRGGMGIVYLAEHRLMERQVAIKVISKSLLVHPTALERFHREVKAAAKLDHKNIVRAHDAEQAGDLHMLVMEYVEGLSLAQVLERKGALPVLHACHYIRQAALGLHEAFGKGMVHRDLKPQNLMLTPKGVVKILDFGLARLASEQQGGKGLTADNAFMGTPDYIAPEQARDARTADIRADIYSLGCTLYALLAGRPPFQEETPVMVIVAHLEKEPQPIHEVRPDVPAELSAVVTRMMAKDPARRYQTPAEVAEALAPFCKGSAKAEPASPPAEPAAAAQAQVPLAVPVARPVAAVEGDDSAASVFAGLTPTALPVAAVRRAQPKAGPRFRLPRWPWLAAAGVLAAALVTLGIVVLVPTKHGTIRIEILPEGAAAHVEVKVDGDVVTLGGLDKPLKLEPRDHQLHITGKDFETVTKDFTVKRGDNPVVRVTLVPKAAKAPGKEPGQPGIPGDSVAGLWKPGRAEGALPGIVPRPAELPGLSRWQIETVAPRSNWSVVAWDPKGRFLACGTQTGEVRLYDAGTLQLQRLLTGHTEGVAALAWSPDGERLASAGDGTVWLWKADGTPELVYRGHTHGAKGVAWAPDNKRLASTGEWSQLRFWDVTGTEFAPPAGAEDNSPSTCVAWSPDGEYVALGGIGRKVYLFKDGKRVATLDCGNSIHAVAWSPDSKMLATAGSGNVIRTWMKNGDPGHSFEGHGNRIHTLAWTPDGKRLASGSHDGTVRLWEADGKFIRSIDPGFAVQSVTWSPDGKRLACLGANIWTGASALRLWNDDGSPGAELPTLGLRPRAVAWSPDGKHLASGMTDHTVRLLRADGATAGVLSGHAGPVQAVAWSPDGKRIASGSDDRTARLTWTDGNRAEPGVLNAGHPVQAVAWGPNGKQVALGIGEAGPALIFESEADGRPGRKLGEGVHAVGLAWGPDGQWLAPATGDLTTRLWKAEGAPGPELKGHEVGISSVAWSPDGRWLATGSDGRRAPHGRWDATVRLWKADGSPGPLLTHPPGTATLSMAWSPDGKRLATGGHSARLWIWEASGERGPVLKGHTSRVHAVAWSAQNKIASAGSDATIRFWDGSTGEPERVVVPLSGGKAVTFSAGGQVLHGDAALVEKEFVYLMEDDKGRRELLEPSEFHKRVAADRRATDTPATPDPPAGPMRHANDALAVAFSPDGQLLASGGKDGYVRLWDPATRQPRGTLAQGKGVSKVAFSPDGKTLAAWAEWKVAPRHQDWTVRLWDLATRKEINRLANAKEAIGPVAFDPKSKRLATASLDRKVRLYDLESGAELARWEPHGTDIHSLAFSPDGTRLATGGGDFVVKVWDINSKKELHSLPVRGDKKATFPAIHCVAFSSDGRFLFAGGLDSNVWNAATSELLWKQRAHTWATFNAHFSPDGKALATVGSAGDGNHVVLTEAATGRQLRTLKGPQEGYVGAEDVALDSQGRFLATAGPDNRVRLWDVNTWEEPQRAEQADPAPGKPAGAAADGFRPLFNGKDLTGWVVDGGDPKAWRVERGELVLVSNPKNQGWLLTERSFADFVLRFEFQLTAGANSGVALRTAPGERHLEVQLLDDSHPANRAAPLPFRTGALWNLALDRAAPLKPLGDWNAMEVEARGKVLRVTVNGQQVLDTELDRFAAPAGDIPALKRAAGRIGLQNWEGAVRFRKIEIKELPPSKPADEGFRPLFNGKDLTGWKKFLDPDKGGDPDKVWTVKDGVLVCEGSVNGYLITDEEYGDYTLRLQWRWGEKMHRNRDSGVLVHVTGPDRIWPNGLEAQLMAGRAGDFWLVGTFQLPPEPGRPGSKSPRHYPRLMEDVEKPLGEWNQCEITCKGDTITLAVNGQSVNAATKAGATRGRILLQSEGAEIHFRNIELKELPKESPANNP